MKEEKINPINRINLHLHTTVSDGALTPAQIVRRCAQIGLDLISITDHDTCDAYKLLEMEDLPLRILPGMEVSSMHEGTDVHVLAYGCKMEDPGLVEMMDMYRSGRRERAVRMIEKLADLDVNISLEEVVGVSGSRELIVRPHIAQILVKRGYAKNKNEAFDKYIGNFGPAYSPKPELSVKKVVDIIHAAGGLAVIAHPGKLFKASYIKEFIGMGIDGLEIWHPDHQPFEVEEFARLCREHGLYMTAGSDFHGEKDKHNLFDSVPATEEILASVSKIWERYKCSVN
ncbi:MAG: PHP domain-containing protein [Candidatus Syntrophosphaera sp.]